MKSLLVFIPAVLLAAPALAQTAPDDAYRDLWCGLAFAAASQTLPFTDEELAAAQAAGDKATDEQKTILEQQNLVEQFVSGGQTLVERAEAAYKAAGFTDESFNQTKSDLEPKVTAQISGTGEQAEFTFEECSALLPISTETPAAGGAATTTTTETPSATTTTTSETPATTTSTTTETPATATTTTTETPATATTTTTETPATTTTTTTAQ
jgi:hypothetical protein